MQHPGQAPQHTAPAPPPQPRGGKRPWLPLKHVIGLVAVFVFIIGGIAGSERLISARLAQVDRAETELAEQNSEDIYSAMTLAMLEGDREAFIEWGEGEAQDQLARIWDETKKIGWTVGAVDSVISDEELNEPSEFDPKRPRPNGLYLAFDLGFPQQRFPDGAEAGCADAVAGCGILTQVFEYDVTVDGGDGSSNSHRITELSPRTPMPWDDANGVHAVRSDNAVLFGYADERERIDQVAGDVQTAAAGVLQTEVATSGFSDVPGFPVFISDDSERYRNAIYGVGEHRTEVDREWEEAGIARIFPAPFVGNEASDLAEERGMFSGVTGQGGVLPALNGGKLGDGALRTAAHEFAHALEMVTFEHYGSSDSFTSASGSFGSEGYARYVEDVVASPHDGARVTLDPEVRATIAATPNSGLQDLLGTDAFQNGATAERAYAAAGNYFAFMAENGVDIAQVMQTGEYMTFEPYLWIGMHHPSTASGESVDATPDAWRAWNAR